MTRGRAHRRATLCVAVFQLALSLGLGLVVCRTANGHVAIESALEDCCPGDALPESSRSLAPRSDCDGCTDTPLRQMGLQRTAASGRETVPAPELFSLGDPLSRCDPAAFALGVTRPDRAVAPPLALRARRSIVLLV